MHIAPTFLVIVSINLLAVGLTVQQDAEPIATSNPEPVINFQDGYIIKFIFRGFDVTKINLFENLSLGSLKDAIFHHEPPVNRTICSSDGTYCYFRQKLLCQVTALESNRTEAKVYRQEEALNPLLNANVTDQTVGNYAYQLFESTNYGQVAAESIYYQSYWNLKLHFDRSANLEFFLTNKFMEDVRNLAGKNMSEYFKFIEQYGTHYFTEVTFGGMFRMQSKATDRFVEELFDEDYRVHLEKNLERVIGVNDETNYSSIPQHFHDNHNYDIFTYGGDTNKTDFKDWQKTIQANIVPIGWKKDTIYNLVLCDYGLFWKAEEIAKNLKLATETIETKYRIQSILDGLKVVQANFYGREISGPCNPLNIQKYFEAKLNEEYPVLDGDFEWNVRCAHHASEIILNRRNSLILVKPQHLSRTSLGTIRKKSTCNKN